MTSNLPIRRGPAITAVLAGMVAASALTAAAQTKGVTATFTATTVNLNPGAGETLKIDVLRWSTDAERDRLLSALKEKGENELREALRAVPTVGYIWTSGSLGYSLRYAHRVPLPDGGERIVIATDLRLGVWDRNNLWKASDQPNAVDYPFTVVELRLNRKGEGEGKMSLATKVTADNDSQTLALENYDAAPLLLKGVKRETSS